MLERSAGFVQNGLGVGETFVFDPGLQRQRVSAHRPGADVDVIGVAAFKINPVGDLSADIALCLTAGAVVGAGGVVPVVMQVVDGLVAVGPHAGGILGGRSDAVVAVIHVNVGIAAA